MSSLQRVIKLLILTSAPVWASDAATAFAGLAPPAGVNAFSTFQRRAAPPPAFHLTGKIGEALSDGRWRFQVLGVRTPDSYTLKTGAEPYGYADVSVFDAAGRTITPKAGYRLVVIECRATNEQKSQERLWVSASDAANVRTALTDAAGSSHAPVAYDFEGGPVQTKPLRPGEAITFPVVFSVPKGAEPKELIFTLAANGERESSRDARVLLAGDAGEKH
jgi:hypothetical protein